jgi:hypothetical protein
MMAAEQANRELATDLTKAEASAISRQIWGHGSRERRPPSADAKPRFIRNEKMAKEVGKARREYDAHEGSTPYMQAWRAFTKLSRPDQEKLIEQAHQYLKSKRPAVEIPARRSERRS